ncbi:MFS transporter [Tistrella bauzanensis]|uniref:MFS transporter n=1 Tax=Tistrella bauzanensis TaxID=657419 RepID=A0ABQ1IH28_9PROT|nr:MFS transporter [Tistrella bauzanensis]GGB40320.1 MFS transporter [Tistrella bauzanensis]
MTTPTQDQAQGQASEPAETPAPALAPRWHRTIACIAASLLLWVTQGLGMNLIAANTVQIQGALGASTNEAMWLVAAYMAPNVSLTIILTKIRTQFGLRRFAEISLGVFVTVAGLHLFVQDLHAAVVVRFLAGIAASPMSTLGFLYMLEAFPASLKMSWGLSLAITCTTLGAPVARIISPDLLDIGLWHGLYVLEIGLALIALAVVHLLPLTPIPHARVLRPLDFVSYPLVAIGFGLLAVVMVLGRYYWWFEAPWIGVCLALAAMAIALAAAIEINREQPLIDIRWLTSPEILHIAAVLLVFRIVLSEQTSGAFGLFQALGLLNEQNRTLQVVILLSSIGGGITCAMVLKPGRDAPIHALALVLIAAGAFTDAHATNLTRPTEMYLSQAMIAFGGVLFLPPSLLAGLGHALRQGPTTITSFIAMFLFTQSLGGLMGSALFGTVVTLREKFHSSQLVETVVMTDPVVVARVRQLAGAYGPVLSDPQLRDAEGLALLSRQASREATILAYNDVFLMVAALAAMALAGLVLHLLYQRIRLAVSSTPAGAAR